MTTRLLPENKEAREYLMQASAYRDNLQTAVQMLEDARSPFEAGSDQDKEWLSNKVQFIAHVAHEHFGGPGPDSPDWPHAPSFAY